MIGVTQRSNVFFFFLATISLVVKSEGSMPEDFYYSIS